MVTNERMKPLQILALKLFRACLRSVRTWPGNAEEKAYIKKETLQGFRESRGITDINEIQKRVRI